MVAYAFPQLVMSRACEVSEVEEWKAVFTQLKRVAKKRAALDREELELIRRAIRVALWRHLGLTSIREVLERECGYGPHVASERVRVAEALDSMPELERALGDGELSYSAVRAISRVATNRTEVAWIAACRGKNQRQIEELLAEREVGDRPETPRKPDLRAKDRTYRGITPSTEAALELARRDLQEEMGERLDDNQLLALLAERHRSGGSRKKARAQIVVTVCPACETGRQLVGNRQIALRPEELARACCDAQRVDVTGARRAVQDVTPALREKVLLRDHGKCRVPGCRAAANIEVHHIEPQELGGPHTMENLIALCDGHHAAHHRGDITIEGPASAAVIVNVAAERADVAAANADAAAANANVAGASADAAGANDGANHDAAAVDCEDIVHVDNWSDRERVIDGAAAAIGRVNVAMRSDAVLALTTLGFTKTEARRAVDGALDDDPRTLDELLRGALRRCPA